MTHEPVRNPFADIAPALAGYTDKVLFGDVGSGTNFRRVTAAWSRWRAWGRCTASTKCRSTSNVRWTTA